MYEKFMIILIFLGFGLFYLIITFLFVEILGLIVSLTIFLYQKYKTDKQFDSTDSNNDIYEPGILRYLSRKYPKFPEIIILIGLPIIPALTWFAIYYRNIDIFIIVLAVILPLYTLVSLTFFRHLSKYHKFLIVFCVNLLTSTVIEKIVHNHVSEIFSWWFILFILGCYPLTLAFLVNSILQIRHGRSRFLQSLFPVCLLVICIFFSGTIERDSFLDYYWNRKGYDAVLQLIHDQKIVEWPATGFYELPPNYENLSDYSGVGTIPKEEDKYIVFFDSANSGYVFSESGNFPPDSVHKGCIKMPSETKWFYCNSIY
jgi:hypothetical protein